MSEQILMDMQQKYIKATEKQSKGRDFELDELNSQLQQLQDNIHSLN